MEAHVSRFHQNLQQMARQQPQVALRLAQMSSESRPVRRKSVAQLLAWASRLPLDGVRVLYVYGLSGGEAYEALSPWLHGRRQRSLVFLEDDPRILHAFLHSEAASRMLTDAQVRVYGFDSPETDAPLFNHLAWDYNLQPIAVAASEAYAKDRADRFAALRDRLLHEHHSKGDFAQEYVDQGIVFYQNFYSNMLQLHTCHLGDALFGRFKGIPAVICGAGPSLNKQIPLLKTLKDRALIFSGGSALNALSHAGLWPHFGCGIDPNMMQLRRLKDQLGNEVPFFFRSRMHHRAFQMIHGDRLYVSGTGGYQTARFFEERLGIPYRELDEGHNVVNFSMSLAQAMGCNPIVLVGLDLAFTNMQTYASGVVNNPNVSRNAVVQDGVLRQDIDGNPIYTQWKWIDESRWITDFAKNHPKVKVMNATEGGLGMNGVPNVFFADAVRTSFKNARDLEGQIWGTIQKATLPKDTRKKVHDAMAELRASLVRCQGLLDQLKEGALPGLQVLLESDLEQEVAFSAILSTFSTFSARMQSRERQWLEWTAADSRGFVVLQRRHYTFLRKVVKSHIALIDYAQSHHKELAMSFPGISKKGKQELKIDSPTKNGKLEGDACVWTAQGQLLSKTRYHQGQREGLCQRFYPNGQLAVEIEYANGEPVGVQRYFYPNGKPKTVIDCGSGKITLYRRNGKVQR